MTNPRTTVQREPILDYWYKTFVYFPRITINDKLVWGRCYRYTTIGVGGLTEGTIYRNKYAATEKEVFVHKLENGSQ